MKRSEIRQALGAVFQIEYDYRLTLDLSIKPYNEDDADRMVELLNESKLMPKGKVAYYAELDNEVVILNKG
jgi:hypothetical protein